MRVGHFFAGGGGGLLASLILGHENVFAHELDPRRCRILRESGWFPGLHVECGNIRQFDPAPWKGRMDCISAGFPCKDISSAGPGGGVHGPRSRLVFTLLDIIGVIQPRLVFLENSPRIRTRGRHLIVGQLVAMGYAWRDGTLAAAHVGAGHLRNRWWCLAADADGVRELEQGWGSEAQWEWNRNSLGAPANSDIPGLEDTRDRHGGKAAQRHQSTSMGDEAPSADPHGRGRCGRSGERHAPRWTELTDSLEAAIASGGLSRNDAEAIAVAAAYTGSIGWAPPHAGVCRVVDGLADRMDRIAACGDGQVPLQAALAWILLSQPKPKGQQ